MKLKSQVLPFMILIMVILMLAIAASYVIGEAGFQKVRLINTLDGAVISSASQICRDLNLVKTIHNAMFLNYISTQTALLTLSFSACTCPVGCGHCWGVVLATVALPFQQNAELVSQAKDLVKKSAEKMRQNIYDTCFGLVDEPAPFLESEVIRNATGRIIGLDYKKYLERLQKEGYPFEQKYIEFKKNHTDWYNYSQLAYFFNKTKQKVLEKEGVFVGESSMSNYDYDCYVKVNLKETPTSIDIDTQTMPMIFFCCISTFLIPQFIPFPNAWIKKVDLDTNYIEAEVEKYLSFEYFSLFPRKVTLDHTARARIRGSIWSGYDFVVEE